MPLLQSENFADLPDCGGDQRRFVGAGLCLFGRLQFEFRPAWVFSRLFGARCCILH